MRNAAFPVTPTAAAFSRPCVICRVASNLCWSKISPYFEPLDINALQYNLLVLLAESNTDTSESGLMRTIGADRDEFLSASVQLADRGLIDRRVLQSVTTLEITEIGR